VNQDNAPAQAKIFGIGLNKTGTTTLGECGRLLGLRCTGCSPLLLRDVVRRRDFTRVREAVSRHDLFEDWPWPLIFRELDAMYPGSKFVLTLRESEHAWLESLKSHAMKTHPVRHSRRLAYGYSYPHRHAQAHLEFYRRHNDAVREYFRDRPGDLLEVCWERGDGLDKLCNFLGLDTPDAPLPHANKGSDKQVSRLRYMSNRLLSKVLP